MPSPSCAPVRTTGGTMANMSRVSRVPRRTSRKPTGSAKKTRTPSSPQQRTPRAAKRSNSPPREVSSHRRDAQRSLRVHAVISDIVTPETRGDSLCLVSKKSIQLPCATTWDGHGLFRQPRLTGARGLVVRRGSHRRASCVERGRAVAGKSCSCAEAQRACDTRCQNSVDQSRSR